MTILYFAAGHVVDLHDFVIKMSGGMNGVKDLGQLDSVLTHIQNDVYYPCFEAKLTHLVFGLVKYHCFTDGNKRTALAAGAYFLEVNRYDWVVDRFIREMENIVVWVAENRVCKSLLLRVITAICRGEDFSDELKLDLITSLDEDS